MPHIACKEVRYIILLIVIGALIYLIDNRELKNTHTHTHIETFLISEISL